MYLKYYFISNQCYLNNNLYIPGDYKRVQMISPSAVEFKPGTFLYDGDYPITNLYDHNLYSFMHSTGSRNQWVKADLGRIYKILQIYIRNRHEECCQHRAIVSNKVQFLWITL